MNLRAAVSATRTFETTQKVASIYFPKGSPAVDLLLAKYKAGLGRPFELDADISVHLAYLDYLALAERYDDLMAYLDQAGLPGETRNACMLRVIQRLAQGGMLPDAQRFVGSSVTLGLAAADQANLCLFRGEMDSTGQPIDRSFGHAFQVSRSKTRAS